MHTGFIQRCRRRLYRVAAVGAFALIPACQGLPGRDPVPPAVAEAEAAGDGMIMRAGNIETEAPSPAVLPELVEAEELYRREDFAGAGKKFRAVAKNEKNPPVLAEKARYFEAECLRQQGYYPEACDTYHRLLQDFPSGVYKEQAVTRMFHIANYWLDDTRVEMDAKQEQDDGKRWMVVPALFHTDKSKPTFDVEGRALKMLEVVHYSDITGPNADKALWLTGYVHFYRGNFREADHYLSQLVEHHKDSKLRPQAIELAIMAKNNSTGGSWYDGRKSDEARKLIHQAQASCPELVAKRGDFLDRQLYAINFQQAEKTFNIAEFYRRTHHPGSAYFYYDLVRRQFPGTKYAKDATQRMTSLRGELVEAQAKGLPGLDAPDFIGRTRIRFNEMLGDPVPVVTPVAVPAEVIDPDGAMSKPIPKDLLLPM